MKIKIEHSGVTLIREPGDKALSHESTVTHNIRRLLNNRSYGWTRCYPDRLGLTSSRQGVRRGTVIYWHANYSIEAAHKAFNAGGVFYNKA